MGKNYIVTEQDDAQNKEPPITLRGLRTSAVSATVWTCIDLGHLLLSTIYCCLKILYRGIVQSLILIG